DHPFMEIIRQVPRYLLDELLADLKSGHNVRATVYLECGAMYRVGGPEALQPVGEIEFVNGVAAMTASGLYGEVRACAGIVGAAAARSHRSRAHVPADDDRARSRRYAARDRRVRGETRGALRRVARQHPEARCVPERRGEARRPRDAVRGVSLVLRASAAIVGG